VGFIWKALFTFIYSGLYLEESRQGMARAMKCVVIGDGGVGKSSLLATYTVLTLRNMYQLYLTITPLIIVVDGEPVNIGLWDTAGQDEYHRLRP
jgi:Rho family protein